MKQPPILRFCVAFGGHQMENVNFRLKSEYNTTVFYTSFTHAQLKITYTLKHHIVFFLFGKKYRMLWYRCCCWKRFILFGKINYFNISKYTWEKHIRLESFLDVFLTTSGIQMTTTCDPILAYPFLIDDLIQKKKNL